jgi:hypothetical protein
MLSDSLLVLACPTGMPLPYNSKLYGITQADRHAISLLNPNVLKPARQSIASFIELSIGQPLPLVCGDDSTFYLSSIPPCRAGEGIWVDERWAVAVSRYDLGEVLRDGVFEQRRL